MMVWVCNVVRVLMLSLLLTSVCAAAGVSELTTLLDGVQTMKADFTQTVYDNYNKPVQKSFGKMAMQRPGKFRWDVKKPMPQLIIANASRLWIYDQDLEQVTIRSLKENSGESPALLLSHDNAVLEKVYTVKSISDSSAASKRFKLMPKSRDSMFASIQLGFLGGVIHEMRLEDHLGHVTVIQFKNTILNNQLPASLFVFKAPANTDVIDETR